ncbi:MAG: 4Fe-4S dicluster domain-containing protein [Deltaproteobacteria bacterium]|nr:4Fe-4S dicluster domain-containing protein [Deltaproteobacteria bacterium]
MSDRYVMVFDPDLCLGCNACTVECRRNYELNGPGQFRLKMQQVEQGSFPDVQAYYVRSSCAHCEKPVCVENCPTGATTKSDDGFVLINKERCIGCGACVDGCPYQARYLRQEGNEVKADKCSFCFSRVADGGRPVCVSKCITGALTFGKKSDPKIQALLARKDAGIYSPEHKTDPQLYRLGVRQHRKDLKTLARSI